jgi:amino acid transporter
VPQNYWDSISCLAGEVEDPSRTFPAALLWGVLLVVASYFLPTLAALGVTLDSSGWELGYYGKVAQQVGVIHGVTFARGSSSSSWLAVLAVIVAVWHPQLINQSCCSSATDG